MKERIKEKNNIEEALKLSRTKTLAIILTTFVLSIVLMGFTSHAFEITASNFDYVTYGCIPRFESCLWI